MDSWCNTSFGWHGSMHITAAVTLAHVSMLLTAAVYLLLWWRAYNCQLLCRVAAHICLLPTNLSVTVAITQAVTAAHGSVSVAVAACL